MPQTGTEYNSHQSNNLVSSRLEDASHVAPALDEIISNKPGYFVRKGTLIICGILCLLIAGMWFIRYPDVLEGSGVLTTDPLPISLKAQATGRLMRLYGSDNSNVSQGQPIAEIENTTGLDAIQVLDKYADSVLSALQRNDVVTLSQLAKADYKTLGDGQRIYNSLVDALNAYVLQKSSGIYAHRSANLQHQNNQYQSLSAISNQERQMIDEELVQAVERFKGNEQLYRDKVISKQEYFDEAARLRQKKLSLEAQKRAGLQNKLAINSNDKQLIDLAYDKEVKENTQSATIREQVRNLQNFVQDWKLKYLLIAPFNGTIHFNRPLQQNEPINGGEELFAVVPTKYQYTATAQVPTQGAGKTAVGQQVHILLDQYPVNEYGYISGEVKDIALLPQQTKDGKSAYRVTVSLSDSLTTSHHKPIAFTGSMIGSARIITKDRNLLQRIFSHFLSLGK
ncbi:MAG: HlyD family efflux transporter periplasmic adaptor subunit [Bacteroidetes bacterium]|nr:HlyD family efflux transporter periplasmic adaptor subunit [Bacteroidota bacterium]MBS1739181.1 HlyD family efflux transporter periplasmic adaptor subunit [Bacteroidota bacterium]